MIAPWAQFKFTREVTMRNNLLVSSMMAFMLTLALGTAEDTIAATANRSASA